MSVNLFKLRSDGVYVCASTCDPVLPLFAYTFRSCTFFSILSAIYFPITSFKLPTSTLCPQQQILNALLKLFYLDLHTRTWENGDIVERCHTARLILFGTILGAEKICMLYDFVILAFMKNRCYRISFV